MSNGRVFIQRPPSPVPRSPMSPIGVQSPFVPFPRIPRQPIRGPGVPIGGNSKNR